MEEQQRVRESVCTSIHHAFSKILEDPQLDVLKQNERSSRYLIEKMKELFLDLFQSQREAQAHSLREQYSLLKDYCQTLSQDKTELERINGGLREEKRILERLNMEQKGWEDKRGRSDKERRGRDILRELEMSKEETRSVQDRMNELENAYLMDTDQLKKVVEDYEQQIRDNQEENEMLRQMAQQYQSQITKIQEEANQKQAEYHTQFEAHLYAQDINNKELILATVRKYKDKISFYKLKISECQVQNQSLMEEMHIKQLQENEEKNAYQKQILHIQAQITQVQTHYEALLLNLKQKSSDELKKMREGFEKDFQYKELQNKQSQIEQERVFKERLRVSEEKCKNIQEGLEGDVNVQRDQLEQLQQEMVSLKDERNALTSRLKNMEQEIVERLEANKQLISSQKQVNDDNNCLRNEMEQVKSSHQQLKLKLSQQMNQILSTLGQLRRDSSEGEEHLLNILTELRSESLAFIEELVTLLSKSDNKQSQIKQVLKEEQDGKSKDPHDESDTRPEQLQDHIAHKLQHSQRTLLGNKYSQDVRSQREQQRDTMNNNPFASFEFYVREYREEIERLLEKNTQLVLEKLKLESERDGIKLILQKIRITQEMEREKDIHQCEEILSIQNQMIAAQQEAQNLSKELASVKFELASERNKFKHKLDIKKQQYIDKSIKDSQNIQEIHQLIENSYLTLKRRNSHMHISTPANNHRDLKQMPFQSNNNSVSKHPSQYISSSSLQQLQPFQEDQQQSLHQRFYQNQPYEQTFRETFSLHHPQKQSPSSTINHKHNYDIPINQQSSSFKVSSLGRNASLNMRSNHIIQNGY